jgi:hypothetical protein
MSQILDQVSVNAENVAKMIAAYYNTLISDGVPVMLAADLTLKFSERIWSGGK